MGDLTDSSADSAHTTITAIERMAAFVLGQTLASQDARARRRALARIDPLVRGAVERRVRIALADAEHAMPQADEAHRIRLAILDLFDRLPPPAERADPARVADAIAALGALPARAPFWSRTLGALGLIALALIALVTYVASRPAPYEALHASAQESASAYRAGGRPLHDETVSEALRTDLPALTIAASRFIQHGVPYEARLAELRARLTRAELVRAAGSFPADALKRLVTTYVGYVDGSADQAAVRAAIRRANDAFVQAGLGYRVESFLLADTVIALTTHRVERVTLHRVGRRTSRVYAIERLDSLNVSIPHLGYVPEGEEVAIVPIDQVDRLVTGVLLPLLDDPPSPTLIDPRTSLARYPWLVPTHASAKQAIRAALVPGCGEALAQVAALLKTRREVYARWATTLGNRGIVLRAPDRYEVDLGSIRRLGERYAGFREVEASWDALGEPAPSHAFACARDALVEAFAIEVQHRALDERAPPATIPPSFVAMLERTGSAPVELSPDDARLHVARARLASMANAGGASGLALTMLLRCYTDGGTCTRGDETATRYLLPELARELHLPSFREPSEIDAAGIAAIYRELAAEPAAALAGAAASTYRRLFGAAPTLID